MATPDFLKIWAQNSQLSPFSWPDADYLKGWESNGSTPPSKQQFDAIQKKNDEKMLYLFDNLFSSSSLAAYLFWRMPSTAYAVGDKRTVKNGPLDVYILCVTAGTTSSDTLDSVSANVGNTFNDGTVVWQVMSVANTTDYAKLASPSFTGTPTAPTAELGTNTTQIATMAAVMAGLQSIVTAADVTWSTDGKTFSCPSLGIAGLMDTNGYISFGKLFGGLILQWGVAKTGTVITFPISFSIFAVPVSAHEINTSADNEMMLIRSHTLSNMTLAFLTTQGATWIAVGK